MPNRVAIFFGLSETVLAHIVPVSNENENERRTLPPVQKQILKDANSDWQREKREKL